MEGKIKIDGITRDRCEYVDPDKVFFTSDTHFHHAKVVTYNGRPFSDVNHMNEEMIRLWNETVPVDGHVFHLGDFSLGTPQKTKEVLERLNGKIYLLKGNHEKSVMRKQGVREMFVWIKDRYELYVPDETARKGILGIVMQHYAMRVWNKSHHGAIHLYGHSHDNLDKEGAWGKSMDVGVDSAYRILGEYRPFSLREVMNIMKKRDIHEIDHHEER
jgi:calcineurin-like phosphoesterase family protein